MDVVIISITVVFAIIIAVSSKKSFVSRMRSFITWIAQLFSGNSDDSNTASSRQYVGSPEVTEVTNLVDPSRVTSVQSHTFSDDNLLSTTNYFADVCTTESIEISEKHEKSDSSSKSSTSSKPNRNRTRRTEQNKALPQVDDPEGPPFEPVKSRKTKSQEKNDNPSGNEVAPLTRVVDNKPQKYSDRPPRQERHRRSRHAAFSGRVSLLPPLPPKPREDKESKKVNSSITYAQIASQSKLRNRSRSPVPHQTKNSEKNNENQTDNQIETESSSPTFLQTNTKPSDEHNYGNDLTERIIHNLLHYRESQNTTDDISSSVLDESSRTDSEEKSNLVNIQKTSVDSTDVDESSLSNREVDNPVIGEHQQLITNDDTHLEQISKRTSDLESIEVLLETPFENIETAEKTITKELEQIYLNTSEVENSEVLEGNIDLTEKSRARELERISSQALVKNPVENIEITEESIVRKLEQTYLETSEVENTEIFSGNPVENIEIIEERRELELDKNFQETLELEKSENLVYSSVGIAEPAMPVRTTEITKKPAVPSRGSEETKTDAIQIRILNLNDQDFHESILYKLEKNWIIEFRLGPSLFGRNISVHCNYPSEGYNFVRSNYRILQWNHDEGCENSDDTALQARIVCKIAGSFHYFFTHNNGKEEKICGAGYFLVDPVIKYGNDEKLPLDCIQCQTIISKHLNSFTTWENKLRVTKESGYNMIHFTPVQELGASNSAYCLKDQLQLNPNFKKESGEMTTWDEIKHFVHKIRKDWKLSSICDIVLNHTANESVWIKEHTEVTYNCLNCKYMRPAYLLDSALHHFSMDIENGLYENRGIPPVIDSEDHINAMIYHFREGVLKELKLHELFICDVNKYVAEFQEKARQSAPGNESQAELKLIQDPEYRRLASSIDMNLALEVHNIYRPGCFDEDSRLRKCCEEFKDKLDSLNNVAIETLRKHLDKAIDCVIQGVRYWRVSPHGPKLVEITESDPLVTRYFTDFGHPRNIKESEEIMYSENSKYLMAHNGWVMDADPLENFAGPQSHVYIRRELIAWGDSVKLNYGEKPSDCPFLWEQMRKYVEITATVFDGVRLDNCHSTPLHVAEYLLDCARKIRPDLYIVAELFTNSDMKDNIFVNRLGITSLIREAMSAPISYEQGRLVYRFGGVPVGSFYQPNVRPLVPTIAHALFYDLTHDNESAIEKRSTFNLLPSSALVNMACCGTGSNRGYDELVPHQISVVAETREYTEWGNVKNPKHVSLDSGIIAAKKALNDLHFKLGSEGFNQVYVDQMDPDIVAVTRHCPKTHQSYVLVAFTAYNHPGENDHLWQRGIKPLVVEGVLDEIVIEATLSHTDFNNDGSKYARPKNYEKNSNFINGFTEYKIDIKQNIQLAESEFLDRTSTANSHEIALNFKNFKPGSIVVIKVSLPESSAKNVRDVCKLTEHFSLAKPTELNQIIKNLNLSDLNRILYRCDQEERDEGYGFDTYDIPNYGKLVYAGLQGFMSLLSEIRPKEDTGHPMCENLRQGNWMIDYIFQRLKTDKNTEELGRWIEVNTKSLKTIPKYLKPAYFDMVFTGIYLMLIKHAHESMSDFVRKGSIFVRSLSMGSIQFAAYIKSADLPVLSPNLTPPKPQIRLNTDGKEVQACVSLSAGLPHFSVGYMRNWGRDTFIALRGLFILTGRYQEARYHILAYAACLRHGLIPNLLDGGRNSRFNCRDAVWWWLYCIKCYTEEVPGGLIILEDKVSRIFPTDDSQPQQPGETEQNLQDVIQEALNRHFQGVNFRERNAGRMIDEHMNDNGFNNQIGVHPETGFVFGGNVDNCGTWMDKMGSSDKAGNRGKPATPRDGSACEIVGLSKCVVTWLAKLHKAKKFKYSGVQRSNTNGNSIEWSFETWSDKIQQNFEKYFWINVKPTDGEIRPDLVNKRGIYKDCYGATQDWTDFQLRCNFPIVMVVAPELFNPEHAWIALEQAEKFLLGPLGMKTLDPSDWSYRGDYDNSNDSDDSNVAHGFNYHQGPEWLWPVGYFLRAKLNFAKSNNKLSETIDDIKCKLAKHYTELQSSNWKGLPELTNSNGSYCKDSSRTQAWSMSTILEVLNDLQKIESSTR